MDKLDVVLNYCRLIRALNNGKNYLDEGTKIVSKDPLLEQKDPYRYQCYRKEDFEIVYDGLK